MDFVESAKSQWSGRYSWGDENQASTGISITGSKILTNYEQYLGTNTRTLTPTLVNEARFGYTRLRNSLGTYSAYNVDTVSALGISEPATWRSGLLGRSVRSHSRVTASPPSAIRRMAPTRSTTTRCRQSTICHGFTASTRSVSASNTRGRTSIRSETSFRAANSAFQPNATQSSTRTGGDAFAEFLLGDIYQSTVAVALANAKFQRNAEAAFIDDTWKVTPRFTLSLGLRYELTPPWTDQLNNLFTVAVPHIYAVPNAPDTPYMLRQGNCTDPYAGPPPLTSAGPP